MLELDLASLEKRLGPMDVVERVLRAFNANVWLVYWLGVPILLLAVPLGLFAWGEVVYALLNPTSPLLSAEVRGVLSGYKYFLFQLPLFYVANKAVFGYCRRSAILALALTSILLLGEILEWAAGRATSYDFDHEIFWFTSVSSLISISCMIFFGIALVSMLRLSPQQRQLLRPVQRPRIFPRRNLRALTCLPDTIDYVRKRRSRLWITTLYIMAASFFSIVPYSLVQSPSNFQRAIAEARQACASSDRKESCFIEESHSNLELGGVTVCVVIVIGLLVARSLLRRAQRRLSFSLHDVIQIDKRPPVVFLRSFADDQVSLKAAEGAVLPRIFQGRIPDIPLEHILVERLTELGPVIALGNPSDTSRPFGAARTYLSQDNWRAELLEYLHEAGHIVICLDNTQGLLWELEQIAQNEQLLAKCLFIVHPRFKAEQTGSPALAPLFEATRSGTSTRVLGWFYVEGQGLQLCHAASFSAKSIERFLRWFMNSWKMAHPMGEHTRDTEARRRPRDRTPSRSLVTSRPHTPIH